ncbi:class I SAM-dependent DNA methyltransferase [Sphingomonas bisphenolicum]
MKSGGAVGFERVDWFNGGLFDDDGALPLDRADIDNLLTAAHLDWSEIDPSILGTLFERGLDPSKRSQLGAHYTDRDKIMQIVRAVLIAPLEAEWADALARMTALVEGAPRATAEKLLRGKELAARTKAVNEAEAIHRAFLERIAGFRVLDPACGSGNFLYLSLLALKDIEHRANLEAEALGLPRGFPRVGPECVLGIELNPYAAELARVSVWIGEIQWMRRNGFDAAKNPILRTLDTIENRDAVLNAGGTRAEWPAADVVVGNPPFLGNKKMLRELGEDYAVALRKAWKDVPGGVDLVCYWFAKAWAQMEAGVLKRAGLVCTNSIRGGANREVLKPIVEQGRIFEAWSDEGWTVDGASVRVSMICFDCLHGEPAYLDGTSVTAVAADLKLGGDGTDLTKANKLRLNANLSFMGVTKSGPFDLEGETARALLQMKGNPNGLPNSGVIKKSVNGLEIVRRPTDRWILDFGPKTTLAEICLFEGPFSYAERVIYPARQLSKTLKNRETWWRFERARPEMYEAIRPLKRYVGTAMVAKYRIFIWLTPDYLPENLVIVIARDDDTTFGILHSRFHEIWSLRMGTFLGVGNDPRYTPSTTFETFPFPQGLTPDIPAANYADDPRAIAIAAAAARLNELRENWLNPADLVRREPEVVVGYPDRILPVSDEAAKILAKRTLTNLYNARPAWLDNAHRALDAAVADAYGWGNDWRAGLLNEDEMLARLFRLNQELASASPI